MVFVLAVLENWNGGEVVMNLSSDTCLVSAVSSWTISAVSFMFVLGFVLAMKCVIQFLAQLAELLYKVVKMQMLSVYVSGKAGNNQFESIH